MRLVVGERVVYASYGVGRISAKQTVGTSGGEAVVLEFEPGLTVTLPIARALEALRCVSTEAELSLVQQALQGEERDDPSWSRRVRAMQERVVRGDAVGLAEVVRDGLHRTRRLAVRGAVPSSSERDLYLRARELLVHEISVSREVDLAAADLWVAAQVSPEAPEAQPPSFEEELEGSVPSLEAAAPAYSAHEGSGQ